MDGAGVGVGRMGGVRVDGVCLCLGRSGRPGVLLWGGMGRAGVDWAWGGRDVWLSVVCILCLDGRVGWMGWMGGGVERMG